MGAFTSGADKIPHVQCSIQKLDTAKILLLILWETKSLDNKKYITLSEKLETIGQNLGGWHGSILKKNSLTMNGREK